MKAASGQLKDRVTFQVNSNTAMTATGRPVENWVELMTRYGRMRLISGRKGLEALQSNLIGKWELVVRYEDALNEAIWKDMRVEYKDKLFYIDRSPERDQEDRPRWLTFILNVKTSN